MLSQFKNLNVKMNNRILKSLFNSKFEQFRIAHFDFQVVLIHKGDYV